MKFTANRYYQPKRVPYASLSKSFAFKGYSIHMADADIRNNDKKMYVEGQGSPEADAPKKRSLCRGSANKPKKTLYNSNYRVKEYALYDAIPSIEAFIDFLFKTFTKEKAAQKRKNQTIIWALIFKFQLRLHRL